MNFIWLLMGIFFVAVFCTAREIIRDARSAPPIPQATSPAPRPVNMARPRARRRQIKWISMKECESLVRRSDDVIFVAIRPGSERKTLSFPSMSVLSITPGQLVDVLPWLAPKSSVVLCGEAHLCSSIVESLDDVAGAAPIYALKPASVRPASAAKM
jgi:hypothetical protein